MAMLRPETQSTTVGWAGRVSSTGTPSPSCSPLSANVSLSPLAKEKLPHVPFLINDGESDGDSWAGSPGALSSPRHSRLSTPSDNGNEARPEVVRLPCFNDIVRFAGGIPSHSTPAPASTIKAPSPASWNWPPTHHGHHQRPQLPRPPIPVPPHRPMPPLPDSIHGHKRTRKPPTNPTGLPRTNRKYTQEQIDFILYFRVDRKMNWQELMPVYKRQFPQEAARTTPGLQGSFYRENLAIPVLDGNGDLLFDENGERIVQAAKIRQQSTKIGLLDRYPDRAIDYPWVDYKDKDRIWNRGKRHQQQLAAAKLRQQRRQAFT